MTDKLNHYLTAWNLSNPRLLAQTPTSHVYTVMYNGETAVLKLLTAYGWEERSGATALRCFDGRGAVRLYAADDDAQLLEYADGDDLLPLVERGDDAEATRIIAGVLAQLHAAPPPQSADGLFTLDRWFQELFARAAADERAGESSIFVRGAAVARRLLADPRDVRVLHGDMHHMNVRHSARGWLAYDPKGLLGDRAYDCANTLCNPYRGQPGYDPLVHNETRLMRNAAILAAALGVPLSRILAFTFAYACLSASWSLGDDFHEEARWALNIAAIVEPHFA